MSRSDLSVALDGVTVRPAFALGGWIAFKPMGGDVMVKGDLVLLEVEVGSVMAKLIANGVEITAIHNHLLRARPAPIYMHVGGHGDPIKLATAIRLALEESKTPMEAPPANSPASAIDLDTAELDQIIGEKVSRIMGCTNSPCLAAIQLPRMGCLWPRLRRSARPGNRYQLPADRRGQGGHHR